MIKLSIEKSKISALEQVTFKGEIKVIETEIALNEALALLTKESYVGVDTETRPSFRKGVVHEVALLQISTHEICYLIRLNKIGFPDNLVSFLEDNRTIKVGLSLSDDIRRLHNVSDFNPSGFIDLQQFVKDFGIMDNGLQRIFAIIFGKRISKGQQLTNWEADTLTINQQIYAATDAWACLIIHDELCKKRFNPYESKYVIPEEKL